MLKCSMTYGSYVILYIIIDLQTLYTIVITYTTRANLCRRDYINTTLVFFTRLPSIVLTLLRSLCNPSIWPNRKNII